MTIHREITLDSQFDSRRLVSTLDRLIVLAEVGLFAVCSDGQIEWRVDLDVVTDVRWEGEIVFRFKFRDSWFVGGARRVLMGFTFDVISPPK